MSEHPYAEKPVVAENLPRPASVVALVRRGRGTDGGSPGPAFEIFVVRRARELKLFGGFVALVGGGLDAADVVDDTGQSLVACAARELFEEAGVLVVKSGGGTISAAVREAVRRELCRRGADASRFRRFLAEFELEIDASRFLPAGRWVTPRFVPARFDAHVFVVEMAPGDEAEVWPGELASGEWMDPARLLAKWESGEVLLHPPQSHLVRALAEHNAALSESRSTDDRNGFDELCRRVATGGHRDPEQIAKRIDFQRGILLVPVLTPTLPPAQHTNCYLVGTGELVVVDPGSPYPEEQSRLHALLDELRAEGHEPRGVVLTHHHADHVGGALALARHLEVPLFGHPRTLDRVPGDAAVPRRAIEDGARFDLEGPMPMRLRAVFTPGHARGHLCFYEERSGALLSGDMVSTLSTIIIDPPEGDLGDYLASLERMRALAPRTLFPAHGLPTQHAIEKLDEYLAHRRARAEALAAALAHGPRELADLVSEVYVDVHPLALPLAERSALASLEWLAKQGRVRPAGAAGQREARWESV